MLISAEYRELNRQLHNERPDYGISGQKWAPIVAELMREYSCTSVLDYGCGKRTLEQALGIKVQNYDPCIEGLDGKPSPADLVVCTDVLEHIEPECVDEVLDDIKRCTRKLAFLTVATGPAKKHLPDGRNAHILVRPYTWWLPQFWERFTMLAFRDVGPDFLVVLK